MKVEKNSDFYLKVNFSPFQYNGMICYIMATKNCEKIT